MNILIYLLISVSIVLIIYYIFLKYAENKINKLETEIKKSFLERTSLIPSIYEVSKEYLTRHEYVFNEIINLRKIEFSETNNNLEISELMNTKKLIHHEINFIFRVCNKHQKLIKEANFIYLRNLIIKKSQSIGEQIENYKKVIKIFNKLVSYKNKTLIGLLLPLQKKVEI